MGNLDPKEDKIHFDYIRKALEKRKLRILLGPGWEVQRYCQMLWIASHQAAIPEATVAMVLFD